MDNIINVEVASEFPGGLGYSYFPSAFVLEIGYKQVRDAASVSRVRRDRRRVAMRSEPDPSPSLMDTSQRAPEHRRRAQVTMARWKYKEIIFAVLHVQEMQNERRNEDGSPVGPPDYEYTLDVSYHPCGLRVFYKT